MTPHMICYSVMHQEAGADGALLIGVDLQKDPAIIERAYNDSAGVTAEVQPEYAYAPQS